MYYKPKDDALLGSFSEDIRLKVIHMILEARGITGGHYPDLYFVIFLYFRLFYL